MSSLTPYIDGPKRIKSATICDIFSQNDMRNPNTTDISFAVFVFVEHEDTLSYTPIMMYSILFEEDGWKFIGVSDEPINATTRVCNAGKLELTTGDKAHIKELIYAYFGINNEPIT